LNIISELQRRKYSASHVCICVKVLHLKRQAYVYLTSAYCSQTGRPWTQNIRKGRLVYWMLHIL